jgi:hypothetical protein
MALVQETAAAESRPEDTARDDWPFGESAGTAGAAGTAETAEAAPGNRGRLIVGLLVLLAVGIGAVGLVLTLAPWANAVGSCGGG